MVHLLNAKSLISKVHYASLSDEVRIGDYYLRALLDEAEQEEAPRIHEPRTFFNDVYHHYLLTKNTQMRCTCLKAMAIACQRHAPEVL